MYSKRKAFNGLCMAIVQASGETGKIKLIANSEGLGKTSIEINVKKGYAILMVP